MSNGPWFRRSCGGCPKAMALFCAGSAARLKRVSAGRRAVLFRRSLRSIGMMSFEILRSIARYRLRRRRADRDFIAPQLRLHLEICLILLLLSFTLPLLSIIFGRIFVCTSPRNRLLVLKRWVESVGAGPAHNQGTSGTR